MNGGFEPLGGTHVVADLDQHHVAADGDTVGGAQKAAARRREFEVVPGVFDQFDHVVEGVGRVVTGQQLRHARTAEPLPAQALHGGHLERFPVGLADIEGELQPEPDDLHRGAAVRVAAHLAAGRLPHSGLFRGGATADRCPHLERHLAAADPAG